MATFKPRLTKPEAGNPYYNTKSNGGYSDAIKGSPTDAGCNVLSNCVGYAYGRFNEIGGYGYCKYLRPVNAENFMQYASGLDTGMTPKLGAVMVWRKGATLSGSDGAGHVAVVEKIISNTEVVTSESGWNSSAFWTKTRKKGSNGNWGASTGYTFLGFIYQPTEYSAGATDKNVGGNTTTGSATTSDGKLTVDGLWGVATTKLLQKIFGLEETGLILNQWAAYKTKNPGLRSGWSWEKKPNRKGDPLIKALQKWAGMPTAAQDGEAGPDTFRAMQRKLGTYEDGRVSSPSAMVKALQKWANNQ